MRKSQVSYTDDHEQSNDCDKISEKDSMSELSHELSKDEESGKIVDISLKQKKTITEKQRNQSRKYRLRIKNLEKQLKEGNLPLAGKKSKEDGGSFAG